MCNMDADETNPLFTVDWAVAGFLHCFDLASGGAWGPTLDVTGQSSAERCVGPVDGIVGQMRHGELGTCAKVCAQMECQT